MQVRTYLELIDDIEALPLPPEYRRLVTEAMRASAARNGVTAVERRERVNFAVHLLELGVPRSAISARLMSLYQIRKTQAHAVISEALVVREFGGKPNA